MPCTFIQWFDETENNVEHCGSPTGFSGCQAGYTGGLCLLRQVERIRRVEHGGFPEIKMCSKWGLQTVLSALRYKQGGGDVVTTLFEGICNFAL